MRTKSRLNIEFLARHFSRLNENPLTAFTGGYRARKARTLHYAIVRRVVARCFSFFHPSFSHAFIPFSTFCPAILSFLPYYLSLSFFMTKKSSAEPYRFESATRIATESYVTKILQPAKKNIVRL